MKTITPTQIERHIVTLRGQRVMLDDDLAKLYGVPTKRLNEQVKRNKARFPGDFMFVLTKSEVAAMRSQNATASRRNIRHVPRAFTEQGVAMLASILNSPRAVAVNIEIVRVFVRLRHALAVSSEIARRLAEVEKSMGQQLVLNTQNEQQFKVVFEALRQLMIEPEPPAPERIGFKTT
ncbi:MAG: ORF6N domain-containing protein [Planctomycetota bacterium]|mgnify:CR=1 FL=1